MRSFLIACLLLAGSCALKPARSTASPLQPALNALLQGDALDALRIFDAVHTPITPKQQAAVDCIRGRFTGAIPSNDLPAAASATLIAYQRCWRAAMMKSEAHTTAESHLLESLNAIRAMAGASDRASLDSVSEYVVTALEAEGLHFSTTTTAKLLANFASLGGDSRDPPHAFAARRVTIALQGVPMERVHEAAVEKFRESTATLVRLGAATTKRFLPD
jgi:hypothetical protein